MCRVDFGDGMVTPLTERSRKARKTHRCNECYRDIQPGETYLYETLYPAGCGICRMNTAGLGLRQELSVLIVGICIE